MQGISTSKHQHLVDALLQLEKLLNREFVHNTDPQMAAELRSELETLFGSYNRQVMALAKLIGDYHELFNKAKIQFLSPKLKELRKKAEHDARVFPLLAQNIRLVYGT
jgi:hypothetical protein